MGLLELLIVDALLTLIFTLFTLLAFISPAKNPVALNLPLVFGGVTLPFAGIFAKLLAYLRCHETDQLIVWLKMDRRISDLLFFDFSVNTYTWLFRIVSFIIAAASAYHLVRFAFG
jgi:hypothetical protein